MRIFLRQAFWAGLLLAGIVLTPFLSSYHLNIFLMVGIYSIVVMGLNLLMGNAGQVSLGNASFFGIGAYVSALLTTRWGIDFWLALPLAAIVAGISGYVVGFTAIRLRHAYLAMATVAFGVIFDAVVQEWTAITGGVGGIGNLPAPRLMGWEIRSDLSYCYLVWAFAFLVIVFVRNIVSSPAGLALHAIRENEMSAGVTGIDVSSYKLRVFGLSALLAGLAGSLFAHHQRFVGPGSFSVHISLILVTMVVVGGAGKVMGSLLGAAVLTVLPDFLSWISKLPILHPTIRHILTDYSYQLIAYGMLLLLFIFFMPRGLAGLLTDLGRWLRAGEIGPGWIPRTSLASPSVEVEVGNTLELVDTGLRASPHAPDGLLLKVEMVSKSFGGLRALDSVSFDVQRGMIHALIGPNGAGKTTLFNIISGVMRKDSGEIWLSQQRITSQPPHQVQKLGIARTFQLSQPFGSLTVLENVMVGCGLSADGSFISGGLGSRNSRRLSASARERAEQLLEFLSLERWARELADNIPPGAQKALEIARALASSPSLILLDEPAAGLNRCEKEMLESAILKVKTAGLTVLLIEHDLAVVMNLSDQVTVLNYGRKIAEGSPAQVCNDPEVISAYLGRSYQVA